MELVLDVVGYQDVVTQTLRRFNAILIQGDRICIDGWI